MGWKKREIRKQVLRVLEEEDRVSGDDLAEELGMNKARLQMYIYHNMEGECVRKERVGRELFYERM